MIPHVYRFRRIEHVLSELEEQQIYFSSPADLNDPMEGFKDLFWSGDEIVWSSLLKHYILSLINIVPSCFLGAPDCKQHLQNAVFASPDDLPAAPAPVRAMYGRVIEKFLSEPATQKFVGLMASRTTLVRRGELTNYLRALHPFALREILNEFAEHGVPVQNLMSSMDSETLRQNAIKMMESASLLPTVENFTEQRAEAFFSLNELTVSQCLLIAEYQTVDSSKLRPISFFFIHFPRAYAEALDRLVHRDWYVACFTANPTDEVMWGTYGDGHRGVCLKFRTSPNSANVPTISLKTVTSLGGDMKYGWSFVTHEFHKVTYAPKYPAIDFFRSLGNVPSQKLNRFWYRGKDHDFSSCRMNTFENQTLREQYWKTFQASALVKTSNWEREQEYRVLLHSGFDLRERPMRTLQFKFEDLSGIIFGARMDVDDKLKIMRVIDQQCAKARRDDFEFSEMRYFPEDRIFRVMPLGLLKFKYDDAQAPAA
jgi:hypothetical protein